MFFSFGAGIFGRIFSAALEVIIFVIAYVIIEMVLNALGFSIPDLIEKLGLLALAIYFVGRVFNFVGPRA